MDAETSNLLYRISMLESDIKILIELNRTLAWTVKEKDDMILELKDQIRYMRELIPHDETLH
jgi:hypothetical protein